jgi:hypothetical protein
MSEVVENNNTVDMRELDAKLFSYEDAKNALLRSGELVEPRSNTGLIIGALVVGAGLGGAAGYFITRRKLETKYNQIAENEIAEMRQYYRDKKAALENTTAKPELETLVREQGYSNQPPMAVTPPDEVVERAETAAEEESSDPRPPVPVVREENIFQQPAPTEEELGEPHRAMENWDWDKERSRRTSNRPYVIHVDEVRESEEYDMVTYTYYEEDDVLCNEMDEVIGKGLERDSLIGEANLNRFGHGSEDPSKVYIRNDQLEMQMEVIRSPNSYAEEVHGFQPSPPDELRHHYRRERRIRDDE